MVQVQAVTLLPEKLGTKGVDGGDIRLIEQRGLPPKADILRLERHTVCQLCRHTAFQLCGGGLGKGDDQEAVNIRPRLHPGEEPFHQHTGLSRTGGGGDQEAAAGFLYGSPLFSCKGKRHGAPHLSHKGPTALVSLLRSAWGGLALYAATAGWPLSRPALSEIPPLRPWDGGRWGGWLSCPWGNAPARPWSSRCFHRAGDTASAPPRHT